MTTDFSIPLLSAHDQRALHLPDARLFQRRADRLRALAPGHATQDFLLFCADLAQAQQTLLDRDEAGADTGLRSTLAGLREQLHRTLPPPGLNALDALLAQDDTTLQGQADALCQDAYDTTPSLLAALPILGAALQILAVMAVRRQDVSTLASAESDICPACGGLPVASVMRRGDSGHGVRYACCSLCASEWHISRIKCVACGNTHHLQYRSQAAQDAELVKPGHKQPHGQRGVQELECCDACHGALKIVSLERDAAADAFADDLASLTLDVLGAEAGYGRIGFNPYFLPGRECA